MEVETSRNDKRGKRVYRMNSRDVPFLNFADLLTV